MARADASGLLRRLSTLRSAATMTPYALSDVALATIRDVQRSAQTSLGGRSDQVGFDLGQFQANIAEPGPLTVTGGFGRVGILDRERMGTLADFERIRGVKGLFHQGTGNVEIWRLVYETPSLRAEVEAERRRVWGSKTPQWWLIEHGYAGSNAYPAVPPAGFIEAATRPAALNARLLTRMEKLFRGL